MLSSPQSPSRTMRILSSAEWCLRVARRISRTSFSADTRVGRPADFWLIFTLLGVTMSQKSSVTQIANLVPYALTRDTIQPSALFSSSHLDGLSARPGDPENKGATLRLTPASLPWGDGQRVPHAIAPLWRDTQSHRPGLLRCVPIHARSSMGPGLARIIHDPLRLVDCLPPFSAEAYC